MFRVSQRGKQYFETARTLLRAVQTVADQAIADQLKVLADDYPRRSEKASQLMRPKQWLARLPALKASDVHDNVSATFEPRSVK